jgi:hypothetical protein
VGDKIIELTAFVMNKPLQTKQLSGSMRIDGFVRGRIEGNVNGVVHAVVKGNVSAYIDNDDVKLLSEGEAGGTSDNLLTGQEGV